MPNLYLGTIGWSYDFWKGKFYPSKTPAKDYLAYYASQFNTVEVDSTFYRIPTAEAVANWEKQTLENFLFSFKFPGRITHIRQLVNCQDETDVFLSRLDLLGAKVGALLMQFPPNFGIEHLNDLEVYLNGLPKNHRYAVEFRNKGWLNSEVFAVLRDNHVALAWTDRPLMDKIKELTADFLYVRWEGDRKKVKGTLGEIEVERTEDLRFEAEKIRPLLQTHMPIFGYFGKFYSGYPPSDVIALRDFFQSKSK
jgi:uncharacterized protein YecE (DUF72 family)